MVENLINIHPLVKKLLSGGRGADSHKHTHNDGPPTQLQDTISLLSY